MTFHLHLATYQYVAYSREYMLQTVRHEYVADCYKYDVQPYTHLVLSMPIPH